jgi:hypothetical protein
MFRALRVAASGLVLGLLIGSLGPVVFVAANIWDDRRRTSDTSEEPPYLSKVWSVLVDQETLPYLAVVAASGAMNGGIGAWAGWRSNRGVTLIAAVPLMLFLFPLVIFAQNPSDSKMWGGPLLVVGILAPFVWVASRAGQEVGVAGRRGRLNEPASSDRPRE